MRKKMARSGERSGLKYCLYHGTAEKYVSSIEAQGLLPQSRLYVHLTDDYGTAIKVGQRHGRAIVYQVSSQAMHRDGYKFFRSVNGVWLTKVVPVQYLINLSTAVFPKAQKRNILS